MLRIINDLDHFFEDCYQRINVRGYARLMKISPPTASKLLSEYEKEGLLKKEIDQNYYFYHANKYNKTFIDLSRIYWNIKLGDTVTKLKESLTNPTIILFGSLSKAEVKENSDIDLAIFATERKINFNPFEKKLKRKIQVLWFLSPKSITSPDLKNSILNGYVLTGRINCD
ncbi:MAG TPA: nucleotidyltransferase domain-containing protein [Candidatus Nanoarchaeia archaeon]|nr:nucleotidyltransferase domain-containing protein [Candidatus Nanoarchaeia archaeon]